MILPLLLPVMLALSTTVEEFIAKAGQQLVISSGICIGISCLSVIGNLLDVAINGYKSDISAAVLMHSYFAGFLVFAGLNIFAVKSGNYSILFASFSTWTVLFVYWLSLCSVLYSDWFSIPSLCLNNRCPESFWFTNWYYHSVTAKDKALTTEGYDKVGAKPLRSLTPPTSSESTTTNHTVTTENVEVTPDTADEGFYDPYIFNFIPYFSSLITNKGEDEPIFNSNFWSKLFSILLCLNFMLFLTMLGSLVWNICNSVCMKNSHANQPVTHGYMYMFELRRRSQEEAQGEPRSSLTSQPGATTTSGPSSSKPPQAPPATKAPEAPPATKAPQATPVTKTPQAPPPTKAPQTLPVSKAPSAPQAPKAPPAPKD